ncbi:ABC transporter permease [Streptomyces sp. AK02-01A]|uniref:ABC transporter permease n=1 Tax=Streptomyces sp. AK02-01A TaxID=3028648 RepID=UPI0029AF6EFB|nr:ABC transporter permease [Streptomyces sp. AK02-01A]MDX3854084.1 ABC transporter permease [Streptomyces sp. AK02-01A]
MRNLIAGEARKALTGRAWWYLPLAGAWLCLITTFGYVSEGEKAIASGSTALAVGQDVARAWMMMFLLSSVFGAVAVTRDYASGTMIRSMLLAGSRSRLFGAKLVVATAAGAVFGLFAVVLGTASVFLGPLPFGLEAAADGETALILAGVFVCCLLAAPWGALVGWIVRSQTGAVATLLALTLAVDPGLQRLVPDAAKFLLTIAMSSVYRDVKPDLLSLPWAYAVIAAWLAAAFLVGRRLVRTRDIV